MLAILKKEINSFFVSTMGYLVICIFLILNGLFLWVFRGEFNILDNGFADLSSFFLISPWILLFLIPAVTMKSFSEEQKQGTIELLMTKPITYKDIVLGKYFGSLVLICIALAPSLLYYYTIYQLGNPTGNIDSGSIISSYVGLILLAASYTAVGTFTSTLSHNQIIGFLSAVLVCFLLYFGFDALTYFNILSGLSLENVSMSVHYERLTHGVIDTRDVIYFISIVILFLSLTIFSIKRSTT